MSSSTIHPPRTSPESHTGLTTCLASDLGPQVFVGDKPTFGRFTPAANFPGDGGWRRKPKGGLWTSSLTPGGESDWIRWGRVEEFGSVDERPWWRLEPINTSPVIVVDGYDDLERLAARYGYKPRSTDFSMLFDFDAMIADGFAGMHLTESGNHACHLSSPLDLNTWDCESTVWFRWVFPDEPVEMVRTQWEEANQ